MISFVFLAILITLVAKRNPLTLITSIEFKWPYLIILGFGIQIALAFIAIASYQKYEIILTLTFLMIVIGLWRNREIKGVKWILIGALLNIFALATHGGLMPVSETAIEITGQQDLSFDTDSRHQPMSMNDPFWLLGDWIPTIRYIFSPGDIIVGIGIIILVFYNSKPFVVREYEKL